MNRGRRRGGRLPRGGLTRLGARVTSLKNAIRGVRVRPPGLPPAISPQPWNSCVISMGLTGKTSETVITLDNVIVALKGQLALPGTASTEPTLLVRVQSLRMWGLGGSALQVALFDVNRDTDQWYIETLEDWPAENQYARIGYHWPAAMQERVLHAVATEIFAFNTSTDNRAILAYLHVLWKVGTIEKPTLRQMRPDPDNLSDDFSCVSLGME